MVKTPAFRSRYMTICIFLFSSFGIPLTAEPAETLHLSFTGDLMAHSINYEMTDYDRIYQGLEGLLLRDDLTFGNVEFPMDPNRPMASFPSFNIHPRYVEAFVRAGLDVFSLANNHTADLGTESLIASVKAARDLAAASDRPLYFSGAGTEPHSFLGGENAETAPVPSFPITTIDHKGWKIGFLAVTQKSNVEPQQEGLLFVLDYQDQRVRQSFIQELSRQTAGYDLFILSYHGGVEYRFVPEPGKNSFFDELIKAGVDIIWSHHPHVMQKMELVRTERGTKAILNSLGNFLSGQGRIIDEVLPEEEWSYTGDSAIIQLIVGKTDQGEATIRHIHPIAIANYITPNREVLIYPLETLVTMPLPPPWDRFYRDRRRIMEGFFRTGLETRDALN